MYIPAHFAEQRPPALQALLRAHPLATLVVTQDDAFVANHIPLMHVADTSAHGVLRGHVARANPLWRALGNGTPALAVFHGADAYVSPSLYPSKATSGKVVPTWNYAVVHVHGRLRAIDDSAWLRQLVITLTDWQEGARRVPWQVTDAPADYIDDMLRAIVGIELEIERIEGKFKLSQNRTADDRDGVITGLSDTPAAAVADMMTALDVDRAAGRT